MINYLFTDHLPLEKKATEKLFDSIFQGKHKGYISELVVNEVLAASEPRRTRMVKIIFGELLTTLPVAKKAEDLANEYIKAKAMTKKHQEDAYHIAIATVNGLEALVSWNLDQIVRLSTKEVVDKVNQKFGYPLIYICTPREVI